MAVVEVAEVTVEVVEEGEEEGVHLVGVVGAEEGEGGKRETEMIVLEGNLTVVNCLTCQRLESFSYMEDSYCDM